LVLGSGGIKEDRHEDLSVVAGASFDVCSSPALKTGDKRPFSSDFAGKIDGLVESKASGAESVTTLKMVGIVFLTN
jgi:hypothetical protein